MVLVTRRSRPGPVTIGHMVTRVTIIQAAVVMVISGVGGGV